MSSPNLKSSLQLAERSQQQFDTLKAKVDAFLQEHPWGTEVVDDEDGWLLLTKIPQQPPDDWWLDVGDLTDNARAALNHLVRQLIIDSGNDPDKGRPQFPIFEVEEHYLGDGNTGSNREKMLKGVAKRHRTVIDGVQPYRLGGGATDHPLSRLRSITDRHKHRDEHVGAMAIEQYSPGATFNHPMIGALSMTIGEVQNPEPLLDGHVLHRVARAKATGDTHVKLPEDGSPFSGLTAEILQPTGIAPDPDVQLTVAFFGDRAFKIEEIAEIVPYVRALIERFERRIVGKSRGSRPTR